MAGWNADTAAAPLSAAVTLLEGSNFCISSANGDILPEYPHGVFYEDTRILSRWILTVNGQFLEPLAKESKEPYRALFAGRVPQSEGVTATPLIVERLREVGIGIQERITIRNYSMKPVECTVEMAFESDFADLFEVKEARIQRRWKETRELDGGSLVIRGTWQDVSKAVVITADRGVLAAEALTCKVTIPPHDHWSTLLAVAPATDGAPASETDARPETDALTPRDRRRREWVAKIPVLQMGNRSIERTLRRSYDDLGSLRIEDPGHPNRIVVAAGAPWFMTLFGRDSLWASAMALPVDPSLALGTLQTLADRQGRIVDPMSEEEPGKILHEVRLDVSSALALGGKSTYYGSADATPLFLMVLGEVSRWGFAKETLAALQPNADRALDWIVDYGDTDGDGFVEYERLNDRGLINQGWKDSWDGINFADGTLAEPPIALCEVQGYVYGAFLASAWMAYETGNLAKAAELRDRAARLKRQFNERFWLPDKGYYAVALDKDKRPVDACASNMGHCLTTGIVDKDKAPSVVERLMSPKMFSGWGVRTLATDMGAYHPASYHNGSVWPHDNAIIQVGLMRYGFVAEAQRISMALLEAAEFSDGRLPELFCGFSREQFTEPVPYPTACSPQAWAATAPIMLVTTLMRYDPDVSLRGIWMDPVLPESYGDLHISNAPIGDARITIDISGSAFSVQGLPDGMTARRGYLPWVGDLMEQERPQL
ncbi:MULTISPECIES: glycogen debranching N-terminal domain-containing protein [Arthrobacter]|uniref:Amylo-alpha-1,6-glucosidase n=1 Tax=Arthrobacter terricola TaxID=2547396 RepID=A0A4R5K990_9MICC|nr:MULTISPECIES: glycogen debranching N-terminal domain-containing protein [Arthrobacter]MBT8163296.1 amylo-alpha-1,6-glucosidase [Arthrobacter sp. GN70]TDF90988.1 amylo-alpha-1,6-glucosidase [Arthrobacter terricola]